MNISEVHDDVLSEIFTYLNYKDILNATLTCKKWRDSIDSLCISFDQSSIKQFYPTIGNFNEN